MITLLYSVLFAELYLYLGLGLTLLISPSALRRYSLLLAPLVGYCYLTLAGWYFFVTGFRGTDSYALMLCLPALGFLGLAVYSHHRGQERRESPFNKDVAVASVLSMAAFIFIALPSIVFRQGLTAISLGNADIAFYSVMARYLKSFRLGEHVGFFGQELLIVTTANDRFGPVIATALPASVFTLETYHLQNIAMYVFFAFTVAMTYVAGRESFGYVTSRAAVGTVLAALSPLLCYGVYHNFEGQIIATGLALALVVLHKHAVGLGTWRDYIRYLPMTALMTWGLIVSYGHMVVLLLAAIGAHVVLVAWDRRSGASIIQWLGFCLGSLLVAVACSPERARLALGQLTFFGGGVGSIVRTPQGWFVPWLFPTGMFTMPSAFPRTAVAVPSILRWCILIASILLMVVGMFVSYRTHRERFRIVTMWFAVIVAGTAALAYADRSAAGWGGYASYKWLSFFLPIVLLGLVAAIAEPYGRFRTRSAICTVCLAGLVSVSAYYSTQEVIAMARVESVSSEVAELQSVESDPRVESVNILEDPGDTMNAMWKANFLARKRLYMAQRTYFSPRPLRGDWTLFGAEPGYGGIIRVGRLDTSDVIRVNQKYLLAPALHNLRVRHGAGWYPAEPTVRWVGNGSASAELILDVTGGPMTVSLAMVYWPLNPRNVLSVCLGGTLLTQCSDNSMCSVPRIELTGGRQVIEFRTALPPARPDNGDPRTLSYVFSKIDITPVR